ncbi:MAG: glycoside hydrolase family 3 C-terminal domain-containing protein [Oscillospiraceae bacterium]|nr:glycoside hydrolase family 3 C-terminal domain-containing protein [Oscillospiraceae bacterium]
MEKSKKIIALLISLIMLLPVFSIAPASVVAAESPLQVFAMDDMSVSSAATNVTFFSSFIGGLAPYTIVWQQSTNGTVWTDVQTTNMSEIGDISFTLATVTTAMSGYKYRVFITDGEGSTTYSYEATLTVTTSSGTASAPTLLGTTSPANNGTVYRNQGVQVTGSVAWNHNMKIYYTWGVGTGTSTEVANTVSTPTMASQLYTGPVVVPSTATNGQIFVIKAIATSDNQAPSSVATFTFTVNTTDATLFDIKTDPQYILWRDNHYAKDVPGITYKWDTIPINGVTDGFGEADKVPAVVYDKVTQVMARMSASDKTNLLNGLSSRAAKLGAVWGTRAMLQYGVMDTCFPDGPVGMDITSGGGSGTGNYERRMTFWPAGMNRAAMWNKELEQEFGAAWGTEMAYFGADMMLGPGQNLHRSTLCGRNFEYFSEDPLLSGLSCGNEVLGMSTQNVNACIKHFAVNNQETGRSNRPTYVSTRALRELYLRNFQYTVELANPWSMMNAFNNVNGPHCAQNYDLNTVLDRYEWGFNGFIMTDWDSAGSSYYNYTNGGGISAGSSSNSQATRVKSGNELMENPSGTASVTAGATYTTQTLSQVEQDQAVRRMLYYAVKGLNFNDKQQSWGATPQWLLDVTRPKAAEVGNEGVVLVQNKDLTGGSPALPITKPTGSQQILMVGSANNTRVHGGTGSGSINMNTADSAITPTLIRAIQDLVGSANVTTNTGDTIAQAQWDTWSSNGTPYTAVIMSIRRTQGESSDVNATGATGTNGWLTSANEQTLFNQASAFARAKGIPFILVMNCCNYTSLNAYVDLFDAIIVDWYQGINGGAPSANVIFGETNPSGKLPTTWPIAVSGNYAGNGSRYNPSEGQFGTSTDIYYYEDIYMGYRYYDTFNVPVQFPFGHGLSFTTFEYSNATLSKGTFSDASDKLTASVTVKNTGSRAGKEVVQFYIGAPGIEINKPVKELKDYAKTRVLEPGESQTITVEFDAMQLASYHGVGDTYNGQWRVEGGHWVIYFASSSKDIRATKAFTVPASFIAQTVLKPNAMAPYATNQTNLNNNARTPSQVIVTFDPGGGNTTFQKRYTYNAETYSDRATYGYLPELPIGYYWADPTAPDVEITEDTVVPTTAHTLVMMAFEFSARVMPADQTVTVGDVATFNCIAFSGEEPYTYQWQIKTGDAAWADIAGETGTTYTFNVAKAMNGNLYRCVVTDADLEVVVSNEAVVTLRPLAASVTPSSQTVLAGNPVIFACGAIGGVPTYTYQWQVKAGEEDWANIAGATGSEYTFTAAKGLNGNSYRCVVTDSDTPSTSVQTDAVSLTVPPLSASITPASVSVTVPSSATFSVVATDGLAPYSYQWQVKIGDAAWTDIAGANGATYTSITAMAMNGNSYRCIVTDGELTVFETNDADLSVSPQVGAPLKLREINDTLTASVTYVPDIARSAMLLLAQYDELGRLVAVESQAAPTTDAGIAVSISASADVLESAQTAKAFLWEGDTYIPLCEDVRWVIGQKEYFSNLALYALVRSTDYQAENPVQNAVNGDRNPDNSNRWAAYAGGYPRWIEVDLGEECELDTLNLFWFISSTRAYQYMVYGRSAPITNWNSPYETNYNFATDNNYTLLIDKSSNTIHTETTDNLSGKSARYILILVTGTYPTANQGNASIRSIEISGSKAAAEEIVVPNEPGHHYIPALETKQIWVDQYASFAHTGSFSSTAQGHRYPEAFQNASGSSVYTLYYLYFEKAGTYTISFRYANNTSASTNQVNIWLDGARVAGGFNFPASGSWTTFLNSGILGVFEVPEPGVHEFRIVPTATSINLLQFAINRGIHTVPAEGSETVWIDQWISHTSTGAVAFAEEHNYLEAFQNASGSAVYALYNINFEEAGTYSISFRYGNNTATTNNLGSNVSVWLDGALSAGPFPNWYGTGGWTTWANSPVMGTFVVPSPGMHEVRIVPSSTSLNILNYTLTKVS